MQEKRECRRTGYAVDADGQENRLYRKSGLPRQQGGVILQIVNLVEVRTAQGRRRYGK